MNHKEIVQIVSHFYNFLTTHPFIPASAIKTPPPDGWPEEYRAVFRKMGKSDEVLELLCHLPYIEDDNWVWFHDTKPINYISPLNQRRIDDSWENKRSLFEPLGQDIGPHVFSLTHGKLYGKWLLLDTQAGTITEYGVYDDPGPKVSEEERASSSVWRHSPTQSIADFFSKCQNKMEGKGLNLRYEAMAETW